MLENELNTTRALVKFAKTYFWMVWIGVITVLYQTPFFKIESLTAHVITYAAAGFALFLYAIIKYGMEAKTLGKYLDALHSKDFTLALACGRRYYSVKRKGFMGADGSGLTIYDEQAISNDIAAYSR